MRAWRAAPARIIFVNLAAPRGAAVVFLIEGAPASSLPAVRFGFLDGTLEERGDFIFAGPFDVSEEMRYIPVSRVARSAIDYNVVMRDSQRRRR